MFNVKLFTVMLLLASAWIFHATMPQKQIVVIPATSDVIKVRPVGYLGGMPFDIFLSKRGLV
tara:strand:+ start:405 stop:590 length:186 start_codon:yes stop_codon:yes gene_type:complete